MKLTLVLMRHGEAESESDVGDHARKLTRRGIAQATATGEKLAQTISGKSFFLVSDAARAQETFSQFKSLFPASGSSVVEDLYLTGLDKIKSVYANVNPTIDCDVLVIVGHNPGLSMAVATLAGDMSGLGTADAAIMTVEADSWFESLEMNGCWDLQTIIRG